VIDLKQLRSAPDQVRAALARRGDPGILDLLAELQELDGRRRVLATQLDGLKAQRNEYAKADAQLSTTGRTPQACVESLLGVIPEDCGGATAGSQRLKAAR